MAYSYQPSPQAGTAGAEPFSSPAPHHLVPAQQPFGQPQRMPYTPHRPINPLPQHNRLQHLQGHPSRPSPAARPMPPNKAIKPRKPRKIIHDGEEASYVQPGPTNRLYLSLKSGLPSQIDWALSKLAQHSHAHRDHTLTFENVPGLADALLSYPRRLCAAVTGQPQELWQGPGFEQEDPSIDVGIGAPGESGSQGGASWHVNGFAIPRKPAPSRRKLRLLMPPSSDVTRARLGALSSQESQGERLFTFDPAHDPTHSDLMRRALEASLILRNMTMHNSNIRHLVGIKGIQSLTRDVLSLPSVVLVREQGAPIEDEEWLELEGISELRLHFLDLLEGLAPKLHLLQRAEFSVLPRGLAGCETFSRLSDDGKATPSEPLKAADSIFLQLLEMVHHSSDRALLIGSLRCLSAMAASEKNEAAFVEMDVENGRQSPGLLSRCVELLPLTQDQEMMEATLDLLYQLVCIGNNGLRLAMSIEPVIDTATGSTELSPRSTSTASARAFSHTLAFVRLLVRNLSIGKTVWERDHKLTLHREWGYAVPSRMREAMRKERELKIKRASETPEQKAAKKRLSAKERDKVVDLTEPERGIAWMKIVFRGSPTKEVTQMEFWTAYKEEFMNLTVPLQPAAELIRNVSQVFPGASAMVIPATQTSNARFIIRGIEVREREQVEPFRCGWKSCPARETRTAEAQRDHALTHVKFSGDNRCAWLSCDFVATSNPTLRAHVLTHLPAPKKTKEPAAKRVKVDEDLRVVDSDFTGVAADFEKGTMPHGARFIKSKREGASESGQFQTKPTAVASESSPAVGTVDNPGQITFSVHRTPSSGADDSPSPQGVAFISLLILRMLTRNASSLLLPRASRAGEDRFGLPLPVNEAAEETEESLATTEEWALEAAKRWMAAIQSVEEELVHQSYANDILCRYINEVVVEVNGPGEEREQP